MCALAAAAAASFSSLTCNTLSLSRRRCANLLFINAPVAFLCRHSFRNPRCRSSSPTARWSLECSWVFPDEAESRDGSDDCGGWAIVQTSIPEKEKGFPRTFVLGIGTSAVILLAAVAHFSWTKKGIKFPLGNPLHFLHDKLSTPTPEVEAGESQISRSDDPKEASVSPEATEVDFSAPVIESITSEKHQPHIIPVAVDSTQQEALSVLTKLKIIEDDVKADELCTRREYARWLVRASSMLERNPKHKIVPSVVNSGSLITAYEDLGIEDPDFGFIQALAETGIILSKLTAASLGSHASFQFSPDRYISRQDIISWRALLEYDFASAENKEMSKVKMDLMDLRDIRPDASPGILMDLVAGDKSLLRRVFGKVRRLQPSKPVTKAQAAVALASGRMHEAIRSELLRLEAEDSSRQAAKEEIRQELLDRGEVQRYWDELMEEEKARCVLVNELYLSVVNTLDEEKAVQEIAFSECLKEKSAMDCQRQLLDMLKIEVDEMTERLASEKAELGAEEERIRIDERDLQVKHDGLLDAKSFLGAEIEALRILRSWIEDEAWKSRARSKVLEKVGQRWRWESQH